VRNGILIVEQPRSSLACGEDCALAIPEWEQFRRTSWELFIPQQLRADRERLVIANAVAAGDKAKAFFQWLRENAFPVPVLAILPDRDNALLQTAADIVDDFLLSPVRLQELSRRMIRVLGQKPTESRDIPASLAAEIGLQQVIGQDPTFSNVLAQITVFSSSNAPVLLTGETGTGKELCARVIHVLSKRQQHPFIPVDCGALPDHLFENELFGHTRGAYTDARYDQKGLVALAQHGTLFMDEIDSLSVTAQSKVLRLLQEHSYRPLGAEHFNQADVRIIAATNRNLEELVSQKHFRSDLFFRINVLRIRVPALRDRCTDIPLLGRHFIEEICRNESMPKKVLSLAAAEKLRQYDWPGNVRELYNIIHRAVLCSPSTQITAAAVDLRGLSDSRDAAAGTFRRAKLNAIAAFERDYVKQLMEKNAGNVTRAAREAGKDRRAFGRLARKYGFRSASV
jgi:DNA-binding NtrC family response regulator